MLIDKRIKNVSSQRKKKKKKNEAGFVFNWWTASTNQLSVITSFMWRASKRKMKEKGGILLNPLQSSPHTHTHFLCKGFSNWGRYDNTHYSVTLCVCGQCRSEHPPPPPPHTHTNKKKKKINPVSGDRALALTIGWIISKQRMRSFETWDSSTCCLQQLAPSIEKWSPFVSQTTNLPSGTWPHCLPQTLPWLSLSFLFFTRPLH